MHLVEHSQTPIDLLLTDVVMPGIGGRQLAKRLLELRPGLHVLYMSGYTDDVISNRGVLPENTLLLPKPFTRAILLRRVREALNAKTSLSSFSPTP
jgi:DNA-binding NarL/FixJ family response regulator